jgi:rod shape-determining protein MreD
MSLTLAAVGALVAALFDTSVAPYLQIGGAQPDLVLVLAMIWTVVVGFEGGLVWAFIGGLAIDLLAPRPLGSTAFVMLLTVGAAAVFARTFVRGHYVRPVIAVFLGSIMYTTLFTAVHRALLGPIPLDDAINGVLPNAVFDALIALLIAPIAVRIHARSADRDRVAW